MAATTHPVEAAEAAGLSYVSDEEPGIRRIRAGKGFRYVTANGSAVSARHKQRITSLVIPPAWSDVWICPSPKGHIQAVGRDDAGRKQYLYHPGWTEARDAEKFANLAAFGQCIPAVRNQVNSDLALRGLPRERVLALVVRLLDDTLIRVGNEAYAARESFGLTTIESRHVDVTGSAIAFEFTGKSAVEHQVELRDQQLAKIIQACDDADGEQLFCYLEDGEVIDVTSDDVNSYLRAIAGDHVTARDFRTWGGTVTTVRDLGASCPRIGRRPPSWPPSTWPPSGSATRAPCAAPVTSTRRWNRRSNPASWRRRGQRRAARPGTPAKSGPRSACSTPDRSRPRG
ncbi:DNA topoisomerase IB [Aquihabitans daechungensis]|uniref:DNA topoisomerase IB n=1 Tax=Aquihabitans daechungensis TaxID=1052257 RepID=UPI003B9FE0F2